MNGRLVPLNSYFKLSDNVDFIGRRRTDQVIGKLHSYWVLVTSRTDLVELNPWEGIDVLLSVWLDDPERQVARVAVLEVLIHIRGLELNSYFLITITYLENNITESQCVCAQQTYYYYGRQECSVVVVERQYVADFVSGWLSYQFTWKVFAGIIILEDLPAISDSLFNLELIKSRSTICDLPTILVKIHIFI